MQRRMKGAIVVIAMLTALVPVAAAHASDGGDDGDQLHGIILSLGLGTAQNGFAGDWMVSSGTSGTMVHVTSTTEIDAEDGVIALGASVEVEGTVGADGSITAVQIKVENDAEDDEFGEVELHGTISSLGLGTAQNGFIGDWIVSGITVHVTPATEIETEGGSLVMGAFVEVKGVADATGLIITASKIELSDGEGDDEDGDEDGDATLTGTLQSASGAPGVWTVSHHGVVVTAHTRIVRNGHALHRGARLRVVGHWRPNGSMRASKIVVKR